MLFVSSASLDFWYTTGWSMYLNDMFNLEIKSHLNCYIFLGVLYDSLARICSSCKKAVYCTFDRIRSKDEIATKVYLIDMFQFILVLCYLPASIFYFFSNVGHSLAAVF